MTFNEFALTYEPAVSFAALAATRGWGVFNTVELPFRSEANDIPADLNPHHENR